MPVNQTNNGKNQSYPIPEAKANLKVDRTLRANFESTAEQHSVENAQPQVESIELEKSSSQNQESTFSKLNIKAAILIGSVVMLPILAVGTATYYFAERELDRQVVLTDRTGDRNLVQIESLRQRNLLSALLIGTGTTALVAGTVAISTTKKLLNRVSEISREQNPRVDKSVLDLNWQQKIFQTIVEEARSELQCDRVIVYSLERPQYGVVIAESVVTGYTPAIGKTIEDPCLEAKHLAKYRYGKVEAIDDIESLIARYREQLKQLQVKASLVTPILHRGNLLGLLVAHQCDAPLAWQQSEINLLHQLAKKAGLLIENARIGDRVTRLQTKAERERKWSHYFNDAVRYIHQSSELDSVLESSVEQIHRVLKCDRVMVYSLEGDKCGKVVAESVSAGYSRGANQTIETASLSAKLEKYRDGVVRAIDNIYEVETSPFSDEQLEALEVKASLITPIFSQGELSVLLVAHQCDRPRNWQDYEIGWMSQIATQVGLALGSAKAVAETIALRDRAEAAKKWTHYFDDTVRQIRQSTEPNSILKISVEQIHRVLKCDRVVVYSLESDRYGVVVAESVSAGYSRTSNRTIETAGLSAKLDNYRDNILAIDNIYQAQLSSDQIEQLEALEVKASLITPIFNKGEFFGIIVAHQCDRPRNWQDYEVSWMSQIATQVGFALDNAGWLEKLQQDKLAMQLLNDFSLKIRETTNRSKLLSTAVEQVRKIMKLDRVIVCQFDDRDRATISVESIAQGYPRALDSVEDFNLTQEYQTKSSQKVEAIADIDRAKLTDSDLEKLKSLGVKASISVPILDQQLFGLLIGHQCQQSRSWSQWETDLFTQLAWQIGLVLERVQLKEELRNNDSILEAEPHALTESNDAENKLAAIEAIAKTTDLENTERSQYNLNQMLGTLHDLAENTDRPAELAKLTQIPTEDTSVKAEEIILDSADRASPEPELIIGEFVEIPSTSNENDVERSPEKMTDLSERILQQSSLVTESFQKLSMFAKQLSEKDKT